MPSQGIIPAFFSAIWNNASAASAPEALFSESPHRPSFSLYKSVERFDVNGLAQAFYGICLYLGMYLHHEMLYINRDQERMVFYEESCMEGSRILTLRIKFGGI